MKKGKTVFVGMSGGVDSSVAAHRLIKQGYEVVGVFIKVWHPDFMTCNWEAERLDAMKVAAHLEIPFLTCDAEEAYKKEVADYFISEYLAGRTPNPDVMCNQAVKFGAFLNFAIQKGADFIATGHYVQKIKDELHRGVDNNKDQSYFLWSLTEKQLAQSLFPVGDTDKETIRKEAAAANIPTAAKKDSQGVCFLGHVDIPDFLSHFTDLSEGSVLDMDGNIIGKHKGALVYTIGQRHGFILSTNDTKREQMFVTAKNLRTNTITVSPTQPSVKKGDTVELNNTVIRSSLSAGDIVCTQIRYRQTSFESKILEVDDDFLKLEFTQETEQPATGQSCVLYRGTECIGGGIIS